MRPALRQEDRELLLSLYLDGELDGGRKALVEEQLRADETWRQAYQALTSSVQRVSKVVETNWHDIEFTGKVMEQIERMPRPSTATALAAQQALAESEAQTARRSGEERAKRRRVHWLGGLAAAAALVLFAFSVKLLLFSKPSAVPAREALRKVARFDSEAFSFSGERSHQAERGTLYAGEELTAEVDGAELHWADGSVLWLRRRTCLTGRSARGLRLIEGAALFHVAPNASTPYSITLPDGSAVRALGTRFEIRCGPSAAAVRVRVVEGHVERRAKLEQGGRAVEARGGQEITPTWEIKAVDPREIAQPWNVPDRVSPGASAQAAPGPAPWSQLGGSPGHSGQTPLRGPEGLAATRFFAFPKVKDRNAKPNAQYAPAVVGAGKRAFVLRRMDRDSTQLYALDLEAANPKDAWRPCGDPLPGHTQNAPVITPKGLVVAGATGKIVQAWDPLHAKVAWKRNVGSSVYALSAAHDGAILCSTFQRLVVLDESGRERWSFSGFSDIQAPAAVRNDGAIVAVSRSGKLAFLDRQGRLEKEARWSGTASIFLPPVLQEDGAVWLLSANGSLRKLNAADSKWKEIFNHTGLRALPLAGGIFAHGHTLRLKDGVEIALPIRSSIVALAADGAGRIYAASKGAVYRITPRKGRQARPPFGTAQKGAIIPGGIAIAPGRLVVTTTAGIQLFE